VTVLRLDAKGAVQKGPTITGPPGAQLPSPILTGAVLEVDAQGLHAGLPLGPGASLALPVRVVVGKPPGSYDASTLQVRGELVGWRSPQSLLLHSGIPTCECCCVNQPGTWC
jgi:hypothetical protein